MLARWAMNLLFCFLNLPLKAVSVMFPWLALALSAIELHRLDLSLHLKFYWDGWMKLKISGLTKKLIYFFLFATSLLNHLPYLCRIINLGCCFHHSLHIPLLAIILQSNRIHHIPVIHLILEHNGKEGFNLSSYHIYLMILPGFAVDSFC